jgi:hypothetical protein
MARAGGMTSAQLAELEVGSSVLVAFATNHGRETVVRRGTVTRLTKTQIIVDLRRVGEERFRREDGIEVGKQSTWSAVSAAQLLDPDSEHTAKYLAEQSARNRRNAVTYAYQAWSKDQTSLELTQKLHAAVGEQLDHVQAQTIQA